MGSRAPLRSGRWVLVMAAADGGGVRLIHPGRASGGWVIGAARGCCKLSLCFRRRRPRRRLLQTGWTEQVRQATGCGVDVVFDGGGGDIGWAPRCTSTAPAAAGSPGMGHQTVASQLQTPTRPSEAASRGAASTRVARPSRAASVPREGITTCGRRQAGAAHRPDLPIGPSRRCAPGDRVPHCTRQDSAPAVTAAPVQVLVHADLGMRVTSSVEVGQIERRRRSGSAIASIPPPTAESLQRSLYGLKGLPYQLAAGVCGMSADVRRFDVRSLPLASRISCKGAAADPQARRVVARAKIVTQRLARVRAGDRRARHGYEWGEQLQRGSGACGAGSSGCSRRSAEARQDSLLRRSRWHGRCRDYGAGPVELCARTTARSAYPAGNSLLDAVVEAGRARGR